MQSSWLGTKAQAARYSAVAGYSAHLWVIPSWTQETEVAVVLHLGVNPHGTHSDFRLTKKLGSIHGTFEGSL
jgi:hypothetical protein